MAFFALMFGISGAVLASFVGVLAERIYTGQSWIRDRSRCNSCRGALDLRDLVPVLSFAAYGGRCRQCGARIPARYAASELVLGLLFAAAYLHLGFAPVLFVFLALLAVLAFVVLYDLRHTVVPESASTLLTCLAIAFAALQAPDIRAFSLTLSVAAAIAFAFLLLFALSKGRAMGLGDAPVAFALSLMAGPMALPGLLYSFWIGALFGLIVLSARRGGPTMGIEVPFVPFLAAGYLLAFFTTWNPFALTLL